MLNVIKKRQNAVGLIILFYLAAVFLLSAAAANFAPPEKSFIILSSGLLIASLGSIGTVLIFHYWEKAIRAEIPVKTIIEKVETAPPSQEIKEDRVPFLEAVIGEKELQLLEQQQKITQLEGVIADKDDGLKQLKMELEKGREETKKVSYDFNAFKGEIEKNLQQKQVMGEEYQQTIIDQRSVIKKKQKLIDQLEEKIRDLNYEIKTLLELNDSFKKGNTQENQGMMIKDTPYTYQVEEEPPLQKNLPASTASAASIQLKRCLNIAQKITGAHHFSGSTAKFKEINIHNFTLDKRRLFDSLRSENEAVVMVYAPREGKPLFVNHEIRSLLGWGPEKFVESFDELIEKGIDEWRRAVSKVSVEQEVQIRLLMRAKDSQEILVHCLLGNIPSGLFKGNTICILYQA